MPRNYFEMGPLYAPDGVSSASSNKKSPEKTGLDSWLETSFDVRSTIRTPGEFDTIAAERKEQIKNLPGEWKELRSKVRSGLKLPEEQIATIYGEQSAGLNEPTLVLGKRLLAQAMRKQHGWNVYEYFADSDVVGSEPGLHSLTVPNPYERGGVEHTATTSGHLYAETPANLVPATAFDLDSVSSLFAKVYTADSSRANELVGAFYQRTKDQGRSYAAAQDAVFRYMQERYGLHSRKYTNDLEADTDLARKGGLDLILANWADIVRLSSEEAARLGVGGVRIPDMTEAPFYAYPKQRDGENNLVHPQIRPRIWIADPEAQSFVATHPYNRNQEMGRFTRDDIMEGRVGVTIRAVPRALLFGTVYDAHISGGGAMYNKVVAPVYERLLGVPFYPIAHMDLVDSEGEQKGVFKYTSIANRKTKAPSLAEAQQKVSQGKVSAADMYVSVDPKRTREIVEETIASPNFSMASRVDLTEAAAW